MMVTHIFQPGCAQARRHVTAQRLVLTSNIDLFAGGASGHCYNCTEVTGYSYVCRRWCFSTSTLRKTQLGIQHVCGLAMLQITVATSGMGHLDDCRLAVPQFTSLQNRPGPPNYGLTTGSASVHCHNTAMRGHIRKRAMLEKGMQ